ncbi:methyl-accepting chemotaxis protein [Paracidovorax anthurii]|uniref:Methyl-accepting chemotaxis protein/methyl-accepting chemotaxis protein-1 (Serine sensor receptor) n=1 Tax=Paracidovorax anthurii TaxID=78229 RepID=A0A328ZMA5_9BURK|nr:methyl-accepting chemotaxis protein [Paracidovorax anthurii]RAR85832.1 methyl-accepting chemotaxis protein/methyl-accepting chemotaxis protein-1 (serine sensor receptor) [Paracidovorax anthurii]
MQFFHRLKISTRLGWLLAALCLLAAGVGAAGLLGMGSSNAGLVTVYRDRVVPLQQIKMVADAYAVNVVDTAHKVRDGAMTPRQGLDSIAAARKDIETQWSAYLATDLHAEERRLIGEFQPLQVRADAAVQTLEHLLRAQDIPGLTAFAAREMYPALDPLQTVLATLTQVQLDTARNTYEAAEVQYHETRTGVIAAVLAGVIVAIGFGMLVVRGILRELGAEPSMAAAVARSVAQGDLTIAIQTRPGDATSLMAQLRRMRDQLAAMVAAIHESAESVSSAALQIAQGNSDLSARTEGQAGALQQTAASMEQLNGTVRQNAGNALEADRVAQAASRVAAQGGAVVAEVVSTMQDINDSSRRIADITGIIDTIAFQTNILALNAAVEAARAGEQGRGFAVVAAEVRQLAQRAGQASGEIKGLVTTSIERVTAGSALVDRAGQTMDSVVRSIQGLSQLVGDITAASQEQRQGVEQINGAVNDMDRTTQHNAALVEEMAAAAAALSQRARELVSAVATFRLPGERLLAGPATPVAAGMAQRLLQHG